MSSSQFSLRSLSLQNATDSKIACVRLNYTNIIIQPLVWQTSLYQIYISFGSNTWEGPNKLKFHFWINYIYCSKHPPRSTDSQKINMLFGIWTMVQTGKVKRFKLGKENCLFFSIDSVFGHVENVRLPGFRVSKRQKMSGILISTKIFLQFICNLEWKHFL